MSEMTLSQALRRIKKLKGELAERQTRGTACVTYNTKKVPAFTFKKCLEEATKIREELVALETDVAGTNATTRIEWQGKHVPLTFALRTLAEIKSEIGWLKGLPVRAQEISEEEAYEYDDEAKRYRTVRTYQCDLPEAAQAAEVRTLQNRFDALNDAVETANHQTRLIGL